MNSPIYRPIPKVGAIGNIFAGSRGARKSGAGLPQRSRAFWQNEARERSRINGLVLYYLAFREIPGKIVRCCVARLVRSGVGCRKLRRRDEALPPVRGHCDKAGERLAHPRKSIFGKTISGENINEINTEGVDPASDQSKHSDGLPAWRNHRDIRLRNGADAATFRDETPPTAKETWEGSSWMSALLPAFS